MKSPVTRPSSLVFLLAALSVFPASMQAKETSLAAADPAAQKLSRSGALPVRAAGPYVEPGTFQIQVAVKLGPPSLRLADGSWIYHYFTVDGSEASGSLLMRFTGGRVSELSLLSPAMLAAVQERPNRVILAAQGKR